MKKKDPYTTHITFTKEGKEIKRELKGELVDVLDLASQERGLNLIPQKTRVLCTNEIHELITTDEVDAGPNKMVDRVSYVGFFEISQGSVVIVGDPVFINGKEIGKVTGFDDTHFPNHYNIVLISLKRVTGYEAGFHIGDEVIIGKL